MGHVQLNVRGREILPKEGELLRNHELYRCIAEVDGRPLYEFSNGSVHPVITIGAFSNPGDEVKVVCMDRGNYDDFRSSRIRFKDRKISVEENKPVHVSVSSGPDFDYTDDEW